MFIKIEMKKNILVLALSLFLINSAGLFARAIKDSFTLQRPSYQRFSFSYQNSAHPSLFSQKNQNLLDVLGLEPDDISSLESFSQETIMSRSQFSLGTTYASAFSLNSLSNERFYPKKLKNYLRPVLEINWLNFGVWTFDKYVLKGSWTNISFRSVYENFKHGYSWDYDDFPTNHFGHAYHGAMYHTFARLNGLNFFESTAYTLLGSFMWEFFWESELPAVNDSIMSTLGGTSLGETLIRIADLMIDERSDGFIGVLQKSLRFFVNPVYSMKTLGRESFRLSNFPDDHDYSLKIPMGAYRLVNQKTNILLAADLEYKDALKKDISEIDPYDWFSLNVRLGFDDNGFRDPEIFTTGFLFGKKIKNGLAGFFGTFDYINTNAVDRMSVAGIGPGLVTTTPSDSMLVFKSSGILSFIFGGTGPSVELNHQNFENEPHEPYHYGLGMLGKVNLELGKKGLGSVHTGFSQYWVRSIFAEANEFLGILTLSLNCDISESSQISFGYDYYLKSGNLEEKSFSSTKNAIRALYVLRF